MPIQNILVVDDSRTESLILERILTKAGFVVKLAADAAEARHMLELLTPDLILMDVVMPGENGFQLTRALAKEPRYAHIPVIICTSKNQETDRVWGLRQGAKGFLTKPVSESSLLAQIASLAPA